MHIFGEIPFVKLQNNTETTDKRLQTMKNWDKIFFLKLFSLVFHRL